MINGFLGTRDGLMPPSGKRQAMQNAHKLGVSVGEYKDYCELQFRLITLQHEIEKHINNTNTIPEEEKEKTEIAKTRRKDGGR